MLAGDCRYRRLIAPLATWPVTAGTGVEVGPFTGCERLARTVLGLAVRRGTREPGTEVAQRLGAVPGGWRVSCITGPCNSEPWRLLLMKFASCAMR